MTPKQAIGLLNEKLEEGKKLLERQPPGPVTDCRAWATVITGCLEELFDSDSQFLTSFKEHSKMYGNYTSGNESSRFAHSAQTTRHPLGPGYVADLTRRIDSSREASMVGTLKTQLIIVKGAIELLEAKLPVKPDNITETSSLSVVARNKVFVVHGHDNEALLRIEKFLRELELEIVILKDEPNKGQTIIEKLFSESSQAGFAIVLLTPDDKGGGKSDSYEKQLFRARQNVIFELGFFLGKLGRKKVSVLCRQGVEILSNYQGVLFTKFDESESWQMKLAKEMKAAGLNFDLNLLVR